MTTVEFLAHLHDIGIKLWAEGERLRYRGSKELLTPALLKELSSRKADLLVLLHATAPQQSIPPATLDGPPPLSFAQQRLWFLDQMLPDSTLYHLPIVMRLTGRLDTAALERTFTEIVRRHAVLRTSFATADRDHSAPVQIIAPPAPHPLNVIEIQTQPGEDSESEALRLITEELQRPFDLQRGPLLRASLLRLPAPDRCAEHILVLTMHHIVGDGWSLGVLVREVAALYSAYAENAAPALPELPIQYADYAVWQRDWLTGELLDREIDHWRRRLADAPSMLELPLDRPRLAVPSYRGASHAARLVDVLPRLKAIGEHEGASLFMTLLAAFYTLLHRYSGQTDLLVGSVIANRTRAELEPLIGFFVNTLVLRADLSNNPRFCDLLAQVRRVTLDAYAHQDVPFEKLVEVLQPERHLSQTPFFQVLFVLQNAPIDTLELPGLTLSPVALPDGSAKFDLTVMLTENGSELLADVEYNTDLFDHTTIERLVSHYQVLLEAIATKPTEQISYLPLLTADERQQSLIDWNRAAAVYPQDAAVAQLIEAQALHQPERAAIVFDGASLNYAELNTRANQLAHYLRAQGVGPDVLVALCVERSLEMIVGMLAILKAGGAYLPLDPTYPAERLQYMVAHSRVPVILTQAALVERLPEHTGQVFCLDADWPALNEQATANPPRTVLPDHLAYIIFTSGSTGKPKGVMVKQRGLINLVYGLRAYFDDPAVETTGLITSISFDISVNQIFPTLIFGRTLHIIPDPVKFNSQALVRYLDEQQVHLLDAVPSYMQAVLNEVAPAQPPNALRYLLIGGEKIEQRLLQAIFGQLGPQLVVVNIYGLTEISDINILGPIRAADLGQPITVGTPLQNNRIYILDAFDQPQPIGIAGEVCVAGDSVSRGYLYRPELTAERFVPCPFENSQLMVRTGDLGRWRDNGTVEILGRIDHQVKVRGFRIETGEIEHALAQQPNLAECVVVVRADNSGDQRLVAYVVPQAGLDAPTPGELRHMLDAQLPGYMIPSAFVVLPALPKTPNGKLDRKALPAPELSVLLDQRFVAPSTPTEELLAAIWADVMHLDRVSTHDSFFELGGHSLLATQVIARARNVFHVELLLRDLFETLTVAGLAQRIDAARHVSIPTIPPITRVDRDQPLPLSFGQQRFWFLDRLAPGSPAYSITLGAQLTGNLDPAALKRSLEALIHRHESLRTVFAHHELNSDDQTLVQVIFPAAEIALPLLDLSAMPAEQRAQQIDALLAAEAEKPFDLSHGPLLRATLLRQHDDEHVLLLALHHSITDGWSMQVLVRELATLYQGLVTGQIVELPPLSVQYADYAVWQRAWLAGDVLDAELRYWKQQLGGTLPILHLPIDRPRPTMPSARGGSQTLVLSPPLTDALKALSRREGTTLFMTLLAAFDVLLHRYTGQTDLLVGTPIAGRIRPELEGVIGLFLNTLVIRTDLTGAPSFRSLLAQVRDTTLAAFDHQTLPFDTLVEELQPERHLSHTPVFQVLFNLLNFADEVFELPELQLSIINPPAPAQFDLTLTVAETLEGLTAEFVYRADLFEAATIVRMAAHFEVLLQGIVADATRSISALPLLTAAERTQLVNGWNPPSSDLSQPQLLTHLFEAQAARTPDAIALIVEQHTLTYAELDARANQLAHELQAQGVGCDMPVGLSLDRSFDLVVGLLAILKAGAIYVPLDPDYPADRLAFMLHDAQIGLVLTQSWLQERLPQTSARYLCIDQAWPVIATRLATPPLSNMLPEHLAYIIYTSGSTGRPKGVMIDHAAAAAHLQTFGRALGLSSDDRVLQFASLSFDVSIEQMFAPLVAGATVVLRGDQLWDLTEIAQHIAAYRLSVVNLPPAYWQEWLHAWIAQGSAQPPAHLRLMIVGGAELPVAAVQLWQQTSLAGIRLLNAYGPTETTITATLAEVSADPSTIANHISLPIGVPLAGRSAYVLDPLLEPTPIGVPGELYIGGASLAAGYRNRPELTAAAFVPDPFNQSAVGGARLYKTGDLVRRHANGMLEFVGRIDQQVKLRGYRIELGEIEAVLRQHPAARDAVVMLRAEPEPRLVAYVVSAHSDNQTDTAETPGFAALGAQIREFASQRLPAYMVPAVVVPLAVLPLTPNGKLDRRALPAPDPTASVSRAAYVAPQTPTEIALAAIWAALLGIERIGIHDTFFELGGHSMLALQVVSRVRQTLQVELPVSDLFTTPTVAALAQHIDVIQWAVTSRAAMTQPTASGEEGEL